MIKNVIVFLYVVFCTFTLHAADTTTIENKVPAEYDTSLIPKKWSEESVVLMRFQQDYEYSITFSGLTMKEIIHEIYYIKDKWGIDELSQLEFPSGVDGLSDDVIGKVIKKDGREIIIRKSELITRKSTVKFNNSRKKKFTLDEDSDQKLAVPSLEVGDFLDLHYQYTPTYIVSFVPLVNKFPMLRYKVSVKLNQDYRSNASVIPSIVNSSAKFLVLNDAYFAVAMDSLDKYQEEILSTTYKQFPYIMIKYADGVNKEDPEIGKLNAQEKIDLQRNIVLEIFSDDKAQRNMSKQISQLLNKKYKGLTNRQDTLAYVNDAFYLYREKITKGYIFTNTGIDLQEYYSDRFFVNTMSRVLFDKKIDYKILLSQPNYFPVPKKYSDFVEKVGAIYIPNLNYYLFNPLTSIDPGVFPSYFENQYRLEFSANKYFKPYRFQWWPLLFSTIFTVPVFDQVSIDHSFRTSIVAAVAFNLVLITPPIISCVNNYNKAKKYRTYDLEEGYFPPATDSNQVIYELKVNTIHDSDNTVSFQRTTSYYGKSKLHEQEKLFAAADIYLKENNEFRRMVYPDAVNNSILTVREHKKLNSLIEADLFSDGFKLKKLKDFKVIETNFFDNSKPFKHSMEFTAQNLAWKFSDYVILDVGRFIGDQLRIPRDSTQRQYDFYIPFRKQFRWNITIPIPDGFLVENLNDFNVRKETAAGSFVASATLENNVVTIKTCKFYKFTYYMKEDVEDVYSFLAEAESYCNKKLIFRKQK